MTAREKPKQSAVRRTGLLPSNLTAGKREKVLDLLAHYRAGSVLLGREQWRLFFETGRSVQQEPRRGQIGLPVMTIGFVSATASNA